MQPSPPHHPSSANPNPLTTSYCHTISPPHPPLSSSHYPSSSASPNPPSLFTSSSSGKGRILSLYPTPRLPSSLPYAPPYPPSSNYNCTQNPTNIRTNMSVLVAIPGGGRVPNPSANVSDRPDMRTFKSSFPWPILD